MVDSVVSLPPSRARLAAVLRAATDVVSVDTVITALGVERQQAAKLLSRWRAQGWLRRVGHGLYVPVPLDLSGNEQVVEDPWVLVPSLFGECYIGGWTAAHHWELTEQLFNETVVFTSRRFMKSDVISQGARFTLHHTTGKHFFGLRTLWRKSAKVRISDPARTMIDMIALPSSGGGIDHVADCLATYMRLQKDGGPALVDYGSQFGNGAIFKRLGFLAEHLLRDDELAKACRERLTQGYTRLDPSMACTQLVTAWRLWVPPRWQERAR